MAVKPTCPAMGARLTAHNRAMPPSSQRAFTLPPSHPPVMLPTAKSQKKLLWMTPNRSGLSLTSRMMSTPATPTTTLSAKLASIKRRSTVRTAHALRLTAGLTAGVPRRGAAPAAAC